MGLRTLAVLLASCFYLVSTTLIMSLWETQGSTYNDRKYPVVDMASWQLAGFHVPTGADSFADLSIIPQLTNEFPAHSWEEIKREGSVTPRADHPPTSLPALDNGSSLGVPAPMSHHTPPTLTANVGHTHSAPYAMTGMPSANTLSSPVTGTQSLGISPSLQPPTPLLSLGYAPECPPWRAPGAPDWPEELRKHLDFLQEFTFLPNALQQLIGVSNLRKRLRGEELHRMHWSTGFQMESASQVPPTPTPTAQTKLQFPIKFTFPHNPARSCQFFKRKVCEKDGSTVSQHGMVDIDNSAGADNSVKLAWTHTHFERWIPLERIRMYPGVSFEQQPDRERWSGTHFSIRAGQSRVDLRTHWTGWRSCIATDRNGQSVPHAENFLPRLEHLSQPKQ